MSQEIYHIPALLHQTTEALDIRPAGVYVDVTFGGGGHSHAIIDRLGDDGHLYAFDQDEDALKQAFTDRRMTLIHGNFRFLRNFLHFHGVDYVDGILGDLGVSFHHFDDPGRGFSFRFDGPLDMRMNRRAAQTAAEVVNNYSEQQLRDVFRLYGEMGNAGRIASLIDTARRQAPIDTVERFLQVIDPAINPRQQKKELAQAFQALRIEVNGEIDALDSLLKQSLQVLKPGGRLVIITYHSLEDRLVKNFMKTGNTGGTAEKDFYGRNLSPMKLLTSKPIIPDDAEVNRNPRSRSAKLRVAVKL